MLYYKKSEQMALKKKKQTKNQEDWKSLIIKQPFKYQTTSSPTSHLLAKRMGIHSRFSKKSAEKKGWSIQTAWPITEVMETLASPTDDIHFSLTSPITFWLCPCYLHPHQCLECTQALPR